MEQLNDNKIRFKYVFDDKYDPVYISGAMGGITPKREVVVNFFFERHPIPYSETYSLDNVGVIGQRIDAKPSVKEDMFQFIRTIKSGVILNLKTAKELREFLDHHIALLEELEQNDLEQQG